VSLWKRVVATMLDMVKILEENPNIKVGRADSTQSVLAAKHGSRGLVSM
jgi:hypothetical protein